MPDLTPSGAIAEAMSGLRDLIAATSWFQSWTGAADAAAAKLHILRGEVGAQAKSKVLASNVATVETFEPHNFSVGQKILLEGLGSPYDGNRTVASVPDALSFTCAITAANQAAATIKQEHFAKVWPAQRPWLVLLTDANPMNIQHVGTGPAAVVSGEILVFVDAAVSSGYQNDPLNANTEKDNYFSQLIDSLGRLSEDYHSWSIEEPAEFVRQQEHYAPGIRFERWNASLRCAWGVDG